MSGHVIYKGNSGGSVIITDSTIERDLSPVVHPCPYCDEVFLTEEDQRQHKADKHPVTRPGILLAGRLIRQNEFIIRQKFDDPDIQIVNTDKVVLSGNNVITTSELKCLILNKKSGAISFEIWHQTYMVKYRFGFEIYEDHDLERTEQVFFDIFSSRLSLSDAFSHFNDKVIQMNCVRPYASSLGSYITAIITKDRLPTAWLPYEQYTSKLGEAYDGLDEYKRPLAQHILAIIRFMQNEFSDTYDDSALPAVAQAKRFFVTGEVTSIDINAADSDIIPIDDTTDLLINYCISPSSLKSDLIHDVDGVYHSPLTGEKDKLKAGFILWYWYKNRVKSKANIYHSSVRHAPHFGPLVINLESLKNDTD